MVREQRVGIVGGLGPESTIDYYRRIIAVWQQYEPRSYPLVIIDSLDVDYGIDLVRNDRDGLVRYLRASVARLAAAGCAFGAMAANTPHVVFNAVAEGSPIPLLSIVETCASEARRLEVRRVGLLGTGFTMEASMYPDVFTRFGIDVRVPPPDARGWLHERYLGELLKGIFTEETRAGVQGLVALMREREGIDAVVLAGTELPLLIKQDGFPDLPLLDTTELHVRAIVDRLRSAAPVTTEGRREVF